MAKLYFKRNINELAELTYKEKGTCPTHILSAFLYVLNRTTGRLPGGGCPYNITRCMAFPKVFIGYFARTQIEEVLLDVVLVNYHVPLLEQHLELVDD